MVFASFSMIAVAMCCYFMDTMPKKPLPQPVKYEMVVVTNRPPQYLEVAVNKRIPYKPELFIFQNEEMTLTMDTEPKAVESNGVWTIHLKAKK